MKVKIKMLYSDAIPPKYAHPGDACADVYSFSMISDDNDNVVIGLGFAMEIPEGHVGLLFPRSSIAKTGHSFRNSVGVIDSGYRGELMIKLSKVFTSVTKFEDIAPLPNVSYSFIHTF